MIKKLFLVLLLLIALLQFIRPARNEGERIGANHISRVYPVPPTVSHILDKACSDCHSDRTSYPWYANLQPLGWWLQHHVDEGRAELNFSAFAGYPAKRQQKKMQEMVEVLQEGEMPLSSYVFIHREAKLSDAERNTLITWARSFGSGATAGANGGEENE